MSTRNKANKFDDAAVYDRAMQELADGEDEILPADIAKRLLAGDESPGKIWREYRGLTQTDLAGQLNITLEALSLLEDGEEKPEPGLLNKIAEALVVDVDDLS